MDPQSPDAPQPERVAVFFQKHRTGLVTLVFTDLADSTALLQKLGDQAGATFLKQRREIIRDKLRAIPEGEEIETAGDSFLLVFLKPSDAVRFALTVQAQLRSFSEAAGWPVQERIGIHLGEVVIDEGETAGKAKDLYGLQVTAAARIMSLADGGQILLSRGVFDSARQVLKGEDLEGIGALSWASYGPYVLKGVDEPVEVCEVGEAGQRKFDAPKTTEKAQRQVRPDEEPVLGWRPALGQEVPNTPWVLEEKLGEGGFGEVWVAQHRKLKERRVFKFCFRADRVRALKREMTLFRLLKEHVGEHPNIVRLYDVYLDEPPFYLEEEYVDGKDLKTWCEARGGVEKVPQELRLEIIAQAAEALQAAHDAGILHRDVKPGNILVSGDSSEARRLVVKLTDFGIGQVISAEYLKGITQTGFTQTMVGSTSLGTGTTMYLAPEIIAGKAASTRSDTYSLGVVLFQLLSGSLARPLTTDWTKELSDPLLREDLACCFAGRPEERFAGVALLATRLRGYEQRKLDQARQAAAVAEKDRLRQQSAVRRKIAVGAAGIVFVLLLLSVALAFGLRKAERQRRIAEQAFVVQRRLGYASNMKAAQAALEQANRGLTQNLLRRYAAQAGEEDLRGLEWRFLWQQSGGDDFRVLPHAPMVVSVAFSPTGRYAATAGRDFRIRIWETALAEPVLEFVAAPFAWDIRKAVAFSSDERWFACPGREGVEIRDTRSWRVVERLRDAEPPLAFSPDARFLVAQGAEGLILCNTADWSRRVLTDVYADCNNLAIGPGGTRIAYSPATYVSRKTAPIYVREVGSGSTLVLEGEDSSASLAFSPDGRWLAAGSSSGEVALWDLTSQQRVRHWAAHPFLLLGLAFSPDGSLLATGGNDQLIKIWETGSTNLVRTLQGHLSEVWALEFSADGRILLSGGKDGTGRLWKVEPDALRTRPLDIAVGRKAVCLSPDAAAVAVVDVDASTANWYALTNGQLIRVVDWKNTWAPSGCRAQATLVTDSVLVGISTDGSVHRWDLTAGAHHQVLEPIAPDAKPLCLGPNGRRLLALSPQDGAILVDLETSRILSRFPDCRVTGAFSPNGRWLAYGTPDFAIKLWDLVEQEEHATVRGHTWRIGSLLFSPDSRLLASGGIDAHAWLWSVETGQPLVPALAGHLSGVSIAGFSADGRTLLTRGDEGATRWWHVATGMETLLFPGLRLQDLGPARPASGRAEDTVLVWKTPEDRLQITTLPTLTEIEAVDKKLAFRRHP